MKLKNLNCSNVPKSSGQGFYKRYNWIYFIKQLSLNIVHLEKYLNWSREVAQWLRELATLVEVPCLVPGTHTAAQNCSITSLPGYLTGFAGLSRHQACICCTYIHTG